MLNILAIGGTGSVGRHVVDTATKAGHKVRVLSRRPASTPGVETVVGDLTDPNTLTSAVDGIDAVVFTHGSHTGEDAIRDVDYQGVLNVLRAIGDRPVRIALMTAIGVTYRDSYYNKTMKAHDWKRRS